MDNDSCATIQGLKSLLLEFRDERDWVKYHDPKNLSEAISIEAAELLELFLWKSLEEVAIALKTDQILRNAIEKELATSSRLFHRNNSNNSAASMEIASARFLGSWNLTQSRSSLNSRRRLFKP